MILFPHLFFFRVNPLKSDKDKVSTTPQKRLVPRHARIHKSSAEFSQTYLADPDIVLQRTSTIDRLRKSINQEMTIEPPSSLNSTKQSKRSRFDLRKSFQRSRSMCVSQFHSWLQRRRQQQPHPTTNLPRRRRKSALDSKSPSQMTPTLLGSPRLARLHQRIFKPQSSSSSHEQSPLPKQTPTDEFSHRSQFDLPMRIYLPPLTSPISRRIRTTSSNTSRTESTPTPTMPKKSTAKERRESFATTPNVFNRRYL